jgi:hypothetical protein
LAGPVAARAGAVAGLVASPHLTGGDSAAMTATLVYGGLLPAAIAYLAGEGEGKGHPVQWAALAGSTAGIVLGPVLNSRLHWSRGRWNLTSLGGAVGALFGGGTAVLAGVSDRGAVALVTGGALAGLALTAALTGDFGSDEPRPGAASLLHLENGKLSAGDSPRPSSRRRRAPFCAFSTGASDQGAATPASTSPSRAISSASSCS